MNKEPRYSEVVVDFVDRVHGTGFPKIRPWRPLKAFPVEFVHVVTGTDGSENRNAGNAENCDAVYKNSITFKKYLFLKGGKTMSFSIRKIGMLKMPKIAMLSTK